MKQINLRLPDDLHTRLVQAAEHDHRSLNSEIIHVLDQHLPPSGGADSSSP